jgi:hypothetical protein
MKLHIWDKHCLTLPLVGEPEARFYTVNPYYGSSQGYLIPDLIKPKQWCELRSSSLLAPERQTGDPGHGSPENSAADSGWGYGVSP